MAKGKGSYGRMSTEEALKQMSTRELDMLFISLEDSDSDMRDKVHAEIKSRVEKIGDAKEES